MSQHPHLFENTSQTTATSVANQLRDEILRGERSVATSLRQDRIAHELGVSTIPVREALYQLNQEGLVEFIPNRGAFVSPLSDEGLTEIYRLRIALETMALEAAMPHLTDEALNAAEMVLVEMDNEQDVYRWGELNWRFHATLLEPCQMPRLMNILRGLHINVIRYLTGNVPAPSEIEMRSNHRAEHYELLDDCRRRDLDIALIHLRRHLRSTSHLLTEHFEGSSKK